MDDSILIDVGPQEAAVLIRAVAKDNAFNRGRKNRMEAWKVMFGVYVSARYKNPVYAIAGLRWKINYVVKYSISHIYGGGTATSGNHVNLPVPNVYAKKSETVAFQSFMMEFESFEGDEEAFRRDFTILRMFSSEWETVEGKGLG